MTDLETYLRAYLADPLIPGTYSPQEISSSIINPNPLNNYLRRYLADPLNIS